MSLQSSSKRLAERWHAQTGAALIEFVIAGMLFLVPVYLAVQAMGKMGDVRHMADAGARYAAWERTVWVDKSSLDATSSAFYDMNTPSNNPIQKSDEQIRNEIAVRLFNDRNSTLAYSDNDKNSSKDSLARFDPLWEDSAGTAYLANYNTAATLSTSTSAPSADLSKVLTGISSAASSLPGVFKMGGILPLPSQTVTQATFTLSNVASNSSVYQRLWSDWTGVTVTGQAAVMTNGWGANSSIGTKAMVKGLVPTAQPAVQAVTEPAVGILRAWQATLPAVPDIGRIAVDVVPNDRLK